MTDRFPTVSIIIPTYNRAGILPRAIDSVINQTFEDFELIVVDDASTDGTAAVVDEYDDERITYICHETNAGNGTARNTGISNSTGTYVAFLDDDDVWLPTKLERQVAVFEQSPQSVGLVYCWMNYYHGDELIERRHPTLQGDILREMLDKNAITSASTIMVRRTAIDTVGKFDTDIPRGVDTDFIRRIAKAYQVEYVPEVLVEYNTGHEYDRVSDFDESGLRAAIEGSKAKFEKFPAAFEQYPEMKASTLAYIGACYGMLGEWKPTAVYFGRAVRITPLSPKVYFQMGRIGKFYLDSYLPSIGRIIDKQIKT